MSSVHHPLEILPDVVWRKIIKNLCPADCRSCNNSCHYFRDLLKSSAMWWNFEKFLPIILGKGKERKCSCCDLIQVFRICKKDLLNCRLVCQTWREAIDDYIDGLQETFEEPLLLNHFHNEAQMDRLLMDMENHALTSTKFMWKNVRIGLRNEEEYFEDPDPPLAEEAVNAFWDKGYVLLQSIGMNITQAFIDGIMECTPAGGLELTKLVRRYLTLMPNVKKLKISNKQLDDEGYWDDFENEINEIGEYLTNNPFPPLPYLKSLILSELMGCLPVSLIDHLTTTYGPQLESLMTWNANMAGLIPKQYNFQVLGNLMKLNMEVFDGNAQIFKYDMDFLDNLNCPLHTMILKIAGMEPLSVAKFLEKIQHLPIKTLDIDLRLSYDECVPESIKLPTIKSLHLKAVSARHIRPPKVLAFDFLECLPNLQNLEFTWSQAWQDVDNELPLQGDEKRIRLNEYLKDDGNLFRSNIWEVLPKLETFKYRRERLRPDLDHKFNGISDEEVDENSDEEVDENLDQDVYGNLDQEDDENLNQDLDKNWKLDDENLLFFHCTRVYTRQHYENFVNSMN